MVLGDYVLEPNDHAFYSDETDSDSDSDDEFHEDDGDFFGSLGLGRTRSFLSNIRYNQGRVADPFDVDHFGFRSVAPTGSGRGLHRLLLERSRRGRRHRIVNAGRR
jgi:hypothetical protein